MAALYRQPAKTEIVSVAIHLADARHQVVQVGFGPLVDRVLAGAVLAPAILPALALMADLPGRNNVFPFNTCRPVGVFARDIAAGFQVYPVAVVFAAAIELRGLRFIQFPGDFLGFAECLGGLGLSGNSKKHTQHTDKTDTH